MNDGKYIMTLEETEYEVFISTLLKDQYPCKDTGQFICISGHFPIPIDSWILKNANLRPVQFDNGNVVFMEIDRMNLKEKE